MPVIEASGHASVVWAEITRVLVGNDAVFCDLDVPLPDGSNFRASRLLLAANAGVLQNDSEESRMAILINDPSRAHFLELSHALETSLPDLKAFMDLVQLAHKLQATSMMELLKGNMDAALACDSQWPLSLAMTTDGIEQLHSTLCSFKTARPPRFCDVTLNVAGDPEIADATSKEAVAVHRLVLAATCGYWRGLWCSGLREARDFDTSLWLEGTHAADLRPLLEFCYYGRVNIATTAELLLTLRLADRWGCTGLANAAAKTLQSELSAAEALDLLSQDCSHSCLALSSAMARLSVDLPRLWPPGALACVLNAMEWQEGPSCNLAESATAFTRGVDWRGVPALLDMTPRALAILMKARLPSWKLIFRQTLPHKWQKGCLSLNPNYPDEDNFAVLDQLEKPKGIVAGTLLVAAQDLKIFESTTSGDKIGSVCKGEVIVAAGPATTVRGHTTVPIKPRGAVDILGLDMIYHFKLQWPADDSGTYFEWKQQSNPIRTTAVKGYEAIHVPFTGRSWGGLRSGSSLCLARGCLATGDSDGWFYAIGAYETWQDGIPAYAKSDSDCLYSQQKVELHLSAWHLSTWDTTELSMIIVEWAKGARWLGPTAEGAMDSSKRAPVMVQQWFQRMAGLHECICSSANDGTSFEETFEHALLELLHPTEAGAVDTWRPCVDVLQCGTLPAAFQRGAWKLAETHLQELVDDRSIYEHLSTTVCARLATFFKDAATVSQWIQSLACMDGPAASELRCWPLPAPITDGDGQEPLPPTIAGEHGSDPAAMQAPLAIALNLGILIAKEINTCLKPDSPCIILFDVVSELVHGIPGKAAIHILTRPESEMILPLVPTSVFDTALRFISEEPGSAEVQLFSAESGAMERLLSKFLGSPAEFSRVGSSSAECLPAALDAWVRAQPERRDVCHCLHACIEDLVGRVAGDIAWQHPDVGPQLVRAVEAVLDDPVDWVRLMNAPHLTASVTTASQQRCHAQQALAKAACARAASDVERLVAEPGWVELVAPALFILLEAVQDVERVPLDRWAMYQQGLGTLVVDEQLGLSSRVARLAKVLFMAHESGATAVVEAVACVLDMSLLEGALLLQNTCREVQHHFHSYAVAAVAKSIQKGDSIANLSVDILAMVLWATGLDLGVDALRRVPLAEWAQGCLTEGSVIDLKTADFEALETAWCSLDRLQKEVNRIGDPKAPQYDRVSAEMSDIFAAAFQAGIRTLQPKQSADIVSWAACVHVLNSRDAFPCQGVSVALDAVLKGFKEFSASGAWAFLSPGGMLEVLQHLEDDAAKCGGHVDDAVKVWASKQSDVKLLNLFEVASRLSGHLRSGQRLALAAAFDTFEFMQGVTTCGVDCMANTLVVVGVELGERALKRVPVVEWSDGSSIVQCRDIAPEALSAAPHHPLKASWVRLDHLALKIESLVGGLVNDLVVGQLQGTLAEAFRAGICKTEGQQGTATIDWVKCAEVLNDKAGFPARGAIEAFEAASSAIEEFSASDAWTSLSSKPLLRVLQKADRGAMFADRAVHLWCSQQNVSNVQCLLKQVDEAKAMSDGPDGDMLLEAIHSGALRWFEELHRDFKELNGDAYGAMRQRLDEAEQRSADLELQIQSQEEAHLRHDVELRQMHRAEMLLLQGGYSAREAKLQAKYDEVERQLLAEKRRCLETEAALSALVLSLQKSQRSTDEAISTAVQQLRRKPEGTICERASGE